MTSSEYSPAMNSALKQLNKLVEDGMEFPDAESKVARKTGFMVEELRAAYDNQFAATGRLPDQETP